VINCCASAFPASHNGQAAICTWHLALNLRQGIIGIMISGEQPKLMLTSDKYVVTKGNLQIVSL
jgi:hypothetical protein